MTISIGDTLPDVTLFTMGEAGPEPVGPDFFRNRKVALFGLPGAFTPTCSARHLPGYVDKADALKEKGIEAIACTSVNDVFVMSAWGKANDTGDTVTLLADGNGDFAEALGLTMDGSKFGMGKRSQRYALVADDAVVTHLFIEAPGEFKVSAVEHMLEEL